MIDKSTDQMLPLGWLALSTSAYRDGFLPRFRKMEQDGLSIIDEWGFLTPDLYWRHGRWMGEPRLECFYALTLLESTCRAAVNSRTQGLRCNLQTDFLNHLLQLTTACEYNSIKSAVCIFSPRIPDSYSRQAWLASLPVLLTSPFRLRLSRLLRDPALLVRVGYQMLVTEWTSHGPSRPETAEALAIFGLGALGLFPRWRCPVCFRLSMPGTTRCWLHRQAGYVRELNKSQHSRHSSAARIGRRVMKELQWPKDDFLNLFRTDSQSEEKTIAGILWDQHVGDDVFSLEKLQSDIASDLFPLARRLLPANFLSLSPSRALTCLRLEIDPNEWIVSCWHLRLFAAELWLQTASELLPGRQHMKVAPRTLELARKAQELIQQGLSQKVAASQLKIKPPYISRLLKRIHSA